MQTWHSNTSVVEKPMAEDKPKEKKQVDILCEGCGKKIPKMRLKILPNTQFCVGCQEEYEQDHPVDDSIYLTEPDPEELNDIISSDD